MEKNTVLEFASELKMPAEVLLEQLNKAGVSKSATTDTLSASARPPPVVCSPGRRPGSGRRRAERVGVGCCGRNERNRLRVTGISVTLRCGSSPAGHPQLVRDHRRPGEDAVFAGIELAGFA